MNNLARHGSNCNTFAKIQQWLDSHDIRYERRIPPTEDDRQWFDRHKRRLHRVRPTISSDHWVFAIGGHSPKGYITIVRRDEYWLAVVGADENRFGPVVNDEHYTALRMEALVEEPRGRP